MHELFICAVDVGAVCMCLLFFVCIFSLFFSHPLPTLPDARQAERSGKRKRGSGSPNVPSASLPAVASRLQDKSRTQRKAGVRERQLPHTKRVAARDTEPPARKAERSVKRGCGGGSPRLQSLVARGCEPLARKAEHSGKRGCGGSSSHLPSDSLPAVASRLQEKPNIAESGCVGAVASTCQALRYPR
jgi:hypothetical protein